jgi:hypothetical protein
MTLVYQRISGSGEGSSAALSRVWQAPLRTQKKKGSRRRSNFFFFFLFFGKAGLSPSTEGFFPVDLIPL